MSDELENPKNRLGVALGLVFVSGFVALIYQVLWMKQLGLLFGNTSHAASATLASFFAGLVEVMDASMRQFEAELVENLYVIELVKCADDLRRTNSFESNEISVVSEVNVCFKELLESKAGGREEGSSGPAVAGWKKSSANLVQLPGILDLAGVGPKGVRVLSGLAFIEALGGFQIPAGGIICRTCVMTGQSSCSNPALKDAWHRSVRHPKGWVAVEKNLIKAI
jgi:hypothetical protein